QTSDLNDFLMFLLHLGLVYATLVWGATFIMVKDALAFVHPVALVGWRFLIAAACLLPFALAKPRPGRFLREGAVLGVWLLILYLAQTAGLKYTSASNSGFITGLFVLFVPALHFILSRRLPAAWELIPFAAAAAGLWLLTGGVRGANRGDLLTLLAAAAYAAHVLSTDRYVRGDWDPVLLSFHQFWLTGAACLAASLAFGLPLSVDGTRAAGVVAFLALIPTLSAFFIQIAAQRHISPLKVSLIFTLEPVFAALFAWTLGGETFDGAKAAGGGLIVAAMGLDSLCRGKEPI
ncbi:MAG: DMT family transporter, partial [Elusimicrobiota bacterium]